VTSADSLKQKLRGISLPFTTPFSTTGDVLFAYLNENLRLWCSSGVSGFVALGSTGERVHLDEREYKLVIENARAQISEQYAFIVGAGQQSSVGTINEITLASRAGADAVLVITPHFYRSAITQEILIDYYTAIADASEVPVLLYSMPALTGIKIEPETIARLSEHPNIIGVKDSSNDVAGFRKTVELCRSDFAVITGNGTVLLDALKAGATGAILAVGCAAPEVCLEVFRLFQTGELERAELLQSKLTPFAAAVTTRFGIGGLKAAMDLAGYHGGTVRAPLQAPNDSQRAELESLFAALEPLEPDKVGSVFSLTDGAQPR
jgi:4-hydroxy-2-oxoglutarate aldolase